MSSPDLVPLAEALRERLAVIADHAHRDRDPAGHLRRLVKVSGRIDSLTAELNPPDLDPQFRHYLERRSYSKALTWIRENVPPGTLSERPVDP
jgi:hypothetical protein